MLRHFAAHPILSRHVKTLVYLPGMVDPDFQYTETEFSNLLSDHSDAKTIERWYGKYLEASKNQQTILDEELDVALFQEIMPKFQNLTSVIITTTAGWPLWRKEHRPHRKPLNKLETCIGGKSGARRYPMAILFPLTGLPTYLRYLELRIVDSAVLSDAFVDIIVHISSNLRTFDMALKTDETGYTDMDSSHSESPGDCRPFVASGNFRRLLASMPQLENLSIAIGVPASAPTAMNQYPMTLDDLFGGERWRNLKSLRLCTFETTRRQLLEFMRRHSATLQSVSLAYVNLAESSWMVLLPELQVLIRESMKLEEFSLYGRLSGRAETFPYDREAFTLHVNVESFHGFDKRLTRYLLDGEGTNPLESYKNPMPNWVSHRCFP